MGALARRLAHGLFDHQIRTGDMAGTWPAVDAWSAQGLEVYTTATCALALYATLEER